MILKIISFHIYYLWVRIKVFAMSKYNEIKKTVKDRFKRTCRCVYVIKPGVVELTCPICKGLQKHSRWQ